MFIIMVDQHGIYWAESAKGFACLRSGNPMVQCCYKAWFTDRVLRLRRELIPRTPINERRWADTEPKYKYVWKFNAFRSTIIKATCMQAKGP